MKLGMISIILPVFNSIKTLRASLESCVQQSYADKEIIVIDGGSTDGSVEVIRSFESKLKYWISEKDGGIYDAWNKGIAVSTGQWLAFFGADDEWANNNSLATLMAKAQFPLVNLVTARLKKLAHGDDKAYEFGAPWSASGMRTKMTIAHVGMPHHRSLFERFGKFDTQYRIAGDYDFLLRAMPDVRPAFVDEVVALMGGGGVSSTQLQRARDESYRALKQSPNAGAFYAWRFLLAFSLRHAVRLLAR